MYIYGQQNFVKVQENFLACFIWEMIFRQHLMRSFHFGLIRRNDIIEQWYSFLISHIDTTKANYIIILKGPIHCDRTKESRWYKPLIQDHEAPPLTHHSPLHTQTKRLLSSSHRVREEYWGEASKRFPSSQGDNGLCGSCSCGILYHVKAII